MYRRVAFLHSGWRLTITVITEWDLRSSEINLLSVSHGRSALVCMGSVGKKMSHPEGG